MVKVKASKVRFSTFKVVGVVFLVATLLVAVLILNDNSRQFLFSSFAKSCADYGDPRARQACRSNEDKQNQLILEQQQRLIQAQGAVNQAQSDLANAKTQTQRMAAADKLNLAQAALRDAQTSFNNAIDRANLAAQQAQQALDQPINDFRNWLRQNARNTYR